MITAKTVIVVSGFKDGVKMMLYSNPIRLTSTIEILWGRVI